MGPYNYHNNTMIKEPSYHSICPSFVLRAPTRLRGSTATGLPFFPNNTLYFYRTPFTAINDMQT
jgi:hypothetical protein